MERIADILVRRDGLSREQAEARVRKAQKKFNRLLENGEEPYDFCYDEFGLEPDYLDQFI